MPAVTGIDVAHGWVFGKNAVDPVFLIVQMSCLTAEADHLKVLVHSDDGDARVRDMEAKGLVSRKVYAEVPPRVEYTLTETGYSLQPLLDVMVAWGMRYKEQNNNRVPVKSAGK